MDTFILDFEKGFDTPLMSSLKVSGSAMEKVGQRRNGMTDPVVVNKLNCDWAPVSTGVLQGTVHSHLLFSHWPCREKPCLQGFRQSEFQTSLFCYRD